MSAVCLGDRGASATANGESVPLSVEFLLRTFKSDKLLDLSWKDGPVRSMSEATQTITRLLQKWGQGQSEVHEALMPLVYEQLRSIAARQFAAESEGHTLQPTALVHEAFMQLHAADLDFNDRNHFFAIAARTMRRVLVDHARSRQREKRGGKCVQVTLSDGAVVGDEPSADLLDLDEAMNELENIDERVARTLELNYFAGLTREQAAEQLDVSVRTLDRDLRVGRAWLKARLT